MADFPTLKGIEDAARLIAAHIAPTPFVQSAALSKALGADIWLKNETTGPIASFKLRGAMACLMRAKARGELKGATTSSTGNHGQGVAYAARALGVPADIFLPAKANPVKAAMIAAFGGKLHKVGKDIDEAKDESRKFGKANGVLFVDDGDDLDVMEGAGTVGLEIARAAPQLDCVFVPVGGANLIGGVATAVKAIHKNAKIIGVQAKGAPTMYESFKARKPVERPVDSIADGLTQRVPPKLALDCLLERTDDMMLTTDDELLAGVHAMLESAHILVEPAGAAPLCGAVARKKEIQGKTVALILSGANLTMDLVRRGLALPPVVALPATP
jgi:threonine dehydratase